MAFIISVGGNFIAMAATLSYTPVTPCRIVDTRNTSAGMIAASTQRDFHIYGDSSTISAQGGNSAGCPAPSGEPLAAHINLVVANPTGKGNMQAFAVGGGLGANLGVNFADIGSNRANTGIIEATVGAGPDITVTSRVSSAHAVIDVLGYYYPHGDLAYTPVKPCRIVDTRNTSAGMIGASTERDFHVFGDSSTISAQGGNSAGCPAPSGEPLAAHINLVVAAPTGKGNMQAFAVGGASGANLGVNFAAIGTNFANAGTVQTATGSGPDIAVTSRVSSAHAVIDVLGYYYNKPNFAPVARTGGGHSRCPGDDGDLQMGVPWPNPRFTDNGDGTVTDHLTGLVWLKEAKCSGKLEFTKALEFSNNLADGQCGLDDGSNPGDWRLPNILELWSLISFAEGEPDGTGLPYLGYPCSEDPCWTSTWSKEGGYFAENYVYVLSWWEFAVSLGESASPLIKFLPGQCEPSGLGPVQYLIA
jgi:hypothetical protein